ncbi:MAG TPA: hypothetical protein VGM84_09110 [Steroidobacteraceae bacterium]|jgi:hypothetical protein
MARRKQEQRNSQFGELLAELSKWQIPEDAIDTVHDVARASLNEVKALTEYEDGKVSRLLTIVAFLSAVIGAAFTRFAGDYNWPAVGAYSSNMAWWLPFSTYVAFFAYVTLVTVSVVVLLGAIRPTFNLPASWKGNGKGGLPPSMLFYKGILDVTARQWAEAFVQQTDAKGKNLKAYYAKCYIGETYLVAEKVADKLRIAAPGVGALRWAMAILLVFFLLFAVTAQCVPITKL